MTQQAQQKEPASPEYTKESKVDRTVFSKTPEEKAELKRIKQEYKNKLKSKV